MRQHAGGCAGSAARHHCRRRGGEERQRSGTAQQRADLRPGRQVRHDLTMISAARLGRGSALHQQAWCAAKPWPSPLRPPTQPAHLCKAVGAALPLVVVQAVRPVLQPLLHEQTLH